MKITTILVAIFMMVVAVPSFAFHNGGSLVCNNCHTMHYSEGGQIPSTANGYPVDADAGGPFPTLLVKANISDLCLECHKDNAYSGAPSVYNTAAGTGTKLPGGDFGYAAKGTGGNAMSAPVGRGHNPFGDSAHPSVNFDKDILNGGADGMTPPGGTSLVDGSWTCVECHQVHGPESGGSRAYGFRLLLKSVNGYDNSGDPITSKAWNLSGGVLVAGPDGADLTKDESATNENVYKGGFSNWCASCHPNFHGTDESDPNVGNGTDFVRHSSNIDISGLSGSPYSAGSTYDFRYPLVQVAGTWTKSAGGTLAATDKIMCLSCHKAHASGNPDALRWDPSGPSAAEQCNKCHYKGKGVL